MRFEDVMNKVKEIVENEVGNLVDYDAILLERGVSSLMMISIVVKIEEEFGIEFEADALSYNVLRSIRSISDKIVTII